MKRIRTTKYTRQFARILTSLFFAIFTIHPSAQAAAAPAQHFPISGYDKAHEITLNGIVREVVSERIAGSPVGLHLLVAGPQGQVDAHLGPYLTKDTQEALHAGEPVQIVGAMEKLHGNSYLLARQLIFGGRLVTVRSERGFLLRAHSSRAMRPQAIKTSAMEPNGGAQ
jgi:hypothetical protein